MASTDPLIRTKLRLPFTPPNLVARPRLQERLAQGLHGPLTLVIAPAGFGKTTLVAAYLARRCLPVAWLSLDKNDNRPGRFLRYLVANYVGSDVTATLTRRADNWNDTFNVGANSIRTYCVEPGQYTYTLSAPPPYNA